MNKDDTRDRNVGTHARSPINRVGGKFRLAKRTVSLMPPHTCYVEPFCGAAHVFFVKPRSKIEVLNDRDGELVNFFRCVQSVPDAVAAALASMPNSRALRKQMRQIAPSALDPVARAARWYYLVTTGFGGGPTKGFAYRKIGNSSRFGAEDFTHVAARLERVTMESLDWRDVISKYDGPETTFFVDPPYLGNKAGYAFNLTEQDHRDLAATLAHTAGKWILTVGNSPTERALYKAYKQTVIRQAQSLKKGRRRTFTTLLIRNF